MADFRTTADVEDWVQRRGLDGVSELRSALAEGRFNARNAQLAQAYLGALDRGEAAGEAANRAALDLRNTEAAERAASAAVESAAQAKRSADLAAEAVVHSKSSAASARIGWYFAAAMFALAALAMFVA